MAKEVWVVVEQRWGKLMAVSLQALGKAQELSQGLKATTAALLIGDKVDKLAQEAINYGANKVYLVKDPRLSLYQSEAYASLTANLVERFRPDILLFGATNFGRDLAPRVAAKLRTGLVAHCIDLYINDKSELVQVVPGLGDNTLVEYVCRRKPQMAQVATGIFSKPQKKEGRKGEILAVKAEIREKDFRGRTMKMIERKPPEISFEEADVVVAGGWGLYAVGGFEFVEELAAVLGGAVGGTRPTVDKGWISEEKLIGQSGKIVSPRLFVSLGASGAMHFTTGFLKSKVILAIDRNPKAPIFDIADVGIVGELEAILPCLLEELRKCRSKNF
jgi:electron transfer flavoprotein alpha subunit